MLNKSLLFIMVSGVIGLSGCATIISGGSDHVTISSGEVDDAKIYVDGTMIGKGNISTPLKRGVQHTIRTEKLGCKNGEKVTGKKFDPISLAGILLDFGIFSIPTDFISGSAMKADQEQYIVTPDCPVVKSKN